MNNFFNPIKTFFAAPVFDGDEDKTRRARLLHVVLAVQAYVIALAFVGSLYVALTTDVDQTVGLIVLGSSFFLVMFWRFLMRRGNIGIASAGLIIAYTLGIGSAVAATGTIQSSGIIFFPLSIVMAVLLISRRAGIVTFIGVTTLGLVVTQMEISGVLPPANTPANLVSMGITLFSGLGLTLVLLYLATQGIENALQRARESEQEVRVLAASLEQRVVERTKALETSAEISRRLTSILDPRDLAKAVVEQVQSVYDYYYAQIYLFDEAGENLVLTSGTGEAGAEMMKRGHSLAKGRGLVGRAADNNASILVADTSQDPDWLPNELLPNTKAEAVVPISIGDQVYGVLDVQDDVTNDITPEDITLLESLAGQVAISLQNAESYARAEAALQEARSLVENAAEGIAVLDLTTGLFTESNANAENIYGLSHDEMMKVGPGQMSPPTQPDGRDSNDAAMEQIGIAMDKGTNTFEWNHINAQGDEFPCEIRLVRLPGDHPRLRVSITNITERQALQKFTASRARQQEAINSITQRIQSATTIEEAMQVAARELGHALGQKQTVVALEPSALGDNGTK